MPLRPLAVATLLLVACLAESLAAAPATAQDPPADTRWRSIGGDQRVQPIGDGLWLHRSDSIWRNRTIDANGLIVVGRDGAVIVDLPWTDEQTARLLDWIGATLDVPVIAIVGSHFHVDAFGGVAEAHRRSIPTWGHTSMAGLAVGAGLEAPSRRFERRAILSLGDRTIEAHYFGPGHSPDGIMVWLPEERILYAGCAAKALDWSSPGNLSDADLERWPSTLRAALALDPATVIPGHGDPAGPDVLTHTIRLIEKHVEESTDGTPRVPGGGGR